LSQEVPEHRETPKKISDKFIPSWRCNPVAFLLERMNVETKYLRMIRGMKRRGRKDWTVYILRCGDGSLYTGVAKDVRARVKQHSEGRGATYTRTRLPVKLLYQQEGLTHSKALIREAQIKGMPRSKKEEIILNEHCT
jgi:predicted GIY-YIG superfamily endonuclease